MKNDSLLIGELALRAGVNRETLRYYERRGILKPSRRSRSGYRLYGPKAEQRLSFIKRAQGFGFGRDLGTPGPPAGQPRELRVLGILDKKIVEIAQQGKEMKRRSRSGSPPLWAQS